MKKALIIFFFVAGLLDAAGQSRIADSLSRIIRRTSNDSIRLKNELVLAKHLFSDLGLKDSAANLLSASLESVTDKKLAVLRARSAIELVRMNGLLLSLPQLKASGDAALNLVREAHLKLEEIQLLRELGSAYTRNNNKELGGRYLDTGFALSEKYREPVVLPALHRTRSIQLTSSDPKASLQHAYLGLELARRYNQPVDEANALRLLAFHYQSPAPDSSIIFLKSAIVICRKAGLKKDLVEMLTQIIALSVLHNEPDISQQYFIEGLQVAGQLESRVDSMNLLLQYALNAQAMGDYPASLEKYIQVLELQKRAGLHERVIYSIVSVGSLYMEQDDYPRAFSYFFEAQDLSEKFQVKEILSYVYNLLAHTHIRAGNLDSAAYYVDKEYPMALEYYKGNIPSYVTNDIGDVYTELGRYDSALQLLRSGYYDIIYSRDPVNICISSLALSKLFSRTNVQDSSRFYANVALQTSVKHKLLIYTVRAANLLKEYFKHIGKSDSALFYLELSIAAKEKLFNREAQLRVSNIGFEQEIHQKELQQQKEKADLRLRNRTNMLILVAGIGLLLIITMGLIFNNRQKQKAKFRVEKAYDELKNTQQQLIQAEKMASLGELTAGIAHEIQNPLNFVNNFSDVSNELLDEMITEIEKGNYKDAANIAADVKQNLAKINHHGKRADVIVKGMLQHSRSSSGQKEQTDINKLVDEYLRLAYHGLRAKDKTFNATIETSYDESVGKVSVVSQDFGRVCLNLISNAFYAVNEKRNQLRENFQPVVKITTRRVNGRVLVIVEDNGNGIPKNVMGKIFQPFFTTKPTGQGTGLGLSLSYDIVKAHGGEINAETKEGEGTIFTITIPVS